MPASHELRLSVCMVRRTTPKGLASRAVGVSVLRFTTCRPFSWEVPTTYKSSSDLKALPLGVGPYALRYAGLLVILLRVSDHGIQLAEMSLAKCLASCAVLLQNRPKRWGSLM